MKTNLLQNKILETFLTKTSQELGLGYLRYEILRRLTPREFDKLYKENIRTGIHFDDLVDKLIEKL